MYIQEFKEIGEHGYCAKSLGLTEDDYLDWCKFLSFRMMGAAEYEGDRFREELDRVNIEDYFLFSSRFFLQPIYFIAKKGEEFSVMKRFFHIFLTDGLKEPIYSHEKLLDKKEYFGGFAYRDYRVSNFFFSYSKDMISSIAKKIGIKEDNEFILFSNINDGNPFFNTIVSREKDEIIDSMPIDLTIKDEYNVSLFAYLLILKDYDILNKAFSHKININDVIPIGRYKKDKLIQSFILDHYLDRDDYESFEKYKKLLFSTDLDPLKENYDVSSFLWRLLDVGVYQSLNDSHSQFKSYCRKIFKETVNRYSISTESLNTLSSNKYGDRRAIDAVIKGCNQDIFDFMMDMNCTIDIEGEESNVYERVFFKEFFSLEILEFLLSNKIYPKFKEGLIEKIKGSEDFYSIQKYSEQGKAEEVINSVMKVLKMHKENKFLINC